MTLRRRWLGLLVLLGLRISAPAAESNFQLDAEPPLPSTFEPGTPWQEGASTLPPWPNDADLIELSLDGPPSSFRYFIDRRNLRIGADGVVRYTLVAQGPSGTRNLSVEGLRCTPRGAHKTYALGIGGRFEPIQEPLWGSIVDGTGERVHQELWRYHFCIPRAFQPRPVPDMVRSLTGHRSSQQDIGFQAD